MLEHRRVLRPPGIVMDYYDGNTDTALWNYAQNYAMSDNNFDTTFGPSTPGALNLISGLTPTASAVTPARGGDDATPARSARTGSTLRRHRPALRRVLGLQPHLHQPGGRDDGQEHRQPAERQARHLGLVPGRLRADLAQQRRRGLRCPAREHRRDRGQEYIAAPGAVPVQRQRPRTRRTWRRPPRPRSAAPTGPTTSTTCPTSPRRSRTATCRRSASSRRRRSRARTRVSPVRSTSRRFLVNTINQIEKSKFWKSTAIVVTYDDSDGWYDHVDAAHRQRLERLHHRRRRVRRRPRSRSAPPTVAAASASGCRCWSSRPGRGRTTSAAT